MISFEDFVSFMAIAAPILLGASGLLVFGVTAWEGWILRNDKYLRTETKTFGDIVVHSPALQKERENSQLFNILSQAREYLGDVSAGPYPSATISLQETKDAAWL